MGKPASTPWPFIGHTGGERREEYALKQRETDRCVGALVSNVRRELERPLALARSVETSKGLNESSERASAASQRELGLAPLAGSPTRAVAPLHPTRFFLRPPNVSGFSGEAEHSEVSSAASRWAARSDWQRSERLRATRRPRLSGRRRRELKDGRRWRRGVHLEAHSKGYRRDMTTERKPQLSRSGHRVAPASRRMEACSSYSTRC